MINAEKLTFGFGSQLLFDRISFSLEKDRHCALIGANGTGKTTLTRLLMEPESFLYDGRLQLEEVGRIACVSQFVTREGDQTVTVFDYLRADFLRLQQEVEQVCAQMGDTEDLDGLMERYQQLLDENDAVDGDNHEVNIRRQLRLAELADKEALTLEQLSGGELKLVQIIRQMLRRPGLLIMDEPDVFLDFENLNGLRDLINSYRGTLLTVTHSRYLLAHCFDRIWHMENCGLQEFDGTYTQYNLARLQTKIDLQLASLEDEEEVRRVTELVDRLRDAASEVAEAQRGRTLKGKVSYLERLLRRQIKAPFVELRRPRIRLPEPSPAEAGTELLRVEDYSLSYERELLRQVSFSVHAGETVALVGANGTGKSSMLRDIRSGSHPAVRYGEEAVPAFFSQLHSGSPEEGRTLRRELADAGITGEEQAEVWLTDWCFSPDDLGKRTHTLSGGEKNLLQLALLSAGSANLLLLDEPSSHLDTFSQIALEEAIAAFPGGVLMVSHDFYTIVNCADTILFAENGTLRPMSARAFRKMIYKNHFSKEYLELEVQKTELETRIARHLERRECAEAQRLWHKLALLAEAMEQA